MAALLSAAAASAQPANNACSNAIVISEGSPAATVSTALATNDGPAACGSAGADVWYRWTAPFTAQVAVDTCGSNFDTVLAVYAISTCPTDNGAQVGCDDDGAACGTTPFRQSRIAFGAVAGSAYYIRVGGFGGATGNVVLNLGPANDSCAGAIPVESGTFSGSTARAQENGPGACSNGADLWYRWTAPSTVGATTITTCGSGYDTVLTVFNAGACPVTAAQLVACSDDDGSCGGVLSSVTFNPVAGQAYLIRIGGFGGATGDFAVNISNSACFGGAPTINGNLLACDNASNTLSVPFLSGASYDWRIDGAPYAISRTVAFGPFSPGNRTVTCIITVPGCGSYTTPPVIFRSLQSPSAIFDLAGHGMFCVGNTINFASTSTGTDITHTWLVDGVIQEGQTGTDFSVLGTTAGEVSVQCQVTNACGTSSAGPINITFFPFPQITQQPAPSADLCSNQNLVLTVAANSVDSFQWTRNNQDIQGQNSPTLNIPAPVPPGTYRCDFRNNCTGTSSQPCQVTVRQPVAATGITPTQTVCQDNNQTPINATVTGDGPLIFTWQRNGQTVQTGPAPFLLVNNTASSNGEYRYTVTNGCSTAQSALTGFLVTATTSISQQPAAAPRFCYGASGSLSVGITGPAISFQWQRNGQPLTNGPLSGGTIVSGVTTPTLSFTDVRFEDAATYRCVITTPCSGSQISAESTPSLGGPTHLVGPGRPFTTIQSAIAALNNCGKVLVFPGTYNERVNFGGKRVYLESAAGPEATTINGGNSSDPVASTITCFDGNADAAAAVIKGFTITGGRGLVSGSNRVGGGIIFNTPASAPTSPLIENCIIQGNRAPLGGGVYTQGSVPLRMVNTIVRENQAISITSDEKFGGGVLVNGGSIQADRCTFTGNTASGGTSNGHGGGLHIGAVGSPSTLTNCLIHANSAGAGGGLRVSGGTLIVTNCTVASNQSGFGPQMHILFDTQVTLNNTIAWSNLPLAIRVTNGATLTANRTNLPSDALGLPGASNISAMPLFVSSTDFRLAPGSPGIDAGNNAFLAPGLDLDRTGNPRFANDPSVTDTGLTGGGSATFVIDMGAFERSTTPTDGCTDAPTLVAGAYPFSTMTATTSTPSVPCGLQDVWLRHVVTCTGTLTVDLCGSSYDTTLSIHSTGDCGLVSGADFLCNDDSGECGLPSFLSRPVTAGETLLIRIAGFAGLVGTGTVTISCTPTPTCNIDFNNDGIVEPGDLDDFITSFFSDFPAERDRCDFNNDGFVEPGDLDEFITAFFGGC